jgi:hypothetical protein
MAWTAPATATVGQILTAAFMNAQLRDNMLLTVPSVVTTDGDIGVATAANAVERWPLLTATNRFVKHEYGGNEFDQSAVTTNDVIGGASAGLMEIKVPVTQAEAEAGTGTRFSLWSPARVKQAIDALVGGHTVASHTDTSATGTELNTLTDSSDADALHLHPSLGSIKSGSYTGDGTTLMEITGLGFFPRLLFITAQVAGAAAAADEEVWWTSDTINDDNAAGQALSWNATNDDWNFDLGGILALEEGKFTVDDDGSDAHPNKNAQVYNYVAVGN